MDFLFFHIGDTPPKTGNHQAEKALFHNNIIAKPIRKDNPRFCSKFSFLRKKIKTNGENWVCKLSHTQFCYAGKESTLLWWRLPSPTGSGADSILDSNPPDGKAAT
ncbi:hypothetical protein [Acidaminococcus massiliensis]|uniref:hypothetical protein n=1 Tax=Acidaminococcus massiliensis TaxID=1852375 RepID=UPI0011785EC3|nr:hypothetical protein [Acidaminococcus massiliensis]